MKNVCILSCCLFLAIMPVRGGNRLARSLSLVPCPVSVIPGTGEFRFSSETVFAVENEEQAGQVRLFIRLFTDTAGFTPRVKVGSKDGDVCFRTDAFLKEEAYTLEITARKITIHASGEQGFFYALQSIRQLLPAAIEGFRTAKRTDWKVPAMTVTDQPRFGYRGLMVDVARFFTPKENLLRIIDCMGMLKLNKLHLHLVDDQGWRIEIKKYPLLTEVGARRVDRPGKLFPERLNARQGEPTVEKGFYAQEDIREIVRYARERQIEVIPEIEMPAHSNAALAAYPLLACPVVDKFISVFPGTGSDKYDIIFCAGNDSVFTFLQGIIDEVVELFPSKYIHLGGDEAFKKYWRVCPLCQARMKQEGLKDEEALQGYFMARMANYVRSKGREVMGWDELTNSTIPEGAIIYGWQGLGKAALKAARQGHRFVMTPAQALYLIRYQGPQWFEPFTYFGNNTLKDVYDYEPVRKDWTPEITSLLMGVQASLWTEFCNSPVEVDYLLFPRLAALSEIAWTAPGRKDWPTFLRAMDSYNTHLTEKGIVYARSMYNIQHTVTVQDARLKVRLDCIRPDVEIRYTTDGSLPTAESHRYSKPLELTASALIKAMTFAGSKRMGALLELSVNWNKATAKPVSAQGAYRLGVLTNGVKGSLKYTDSEWCSWAKNDSVSFTVDLMKPEVLNSLKIGAINNYGMAAHPPMKLEVWISDDNKEFRKVGEQSYAREEVFRKGISHRELPVKVRGKARYIRVVAYGPGQCPAWHIQPHKVGRMYFDEVVIE